MTQMMDKEKREKWFAFVQELNPDIDPQVIRLMDRMRMVSHTLYQKGEGSLAAAGISYARFRLLMSLFFDEEIEDRTGLNPSEISKKQGISRNTVSSLIRELEDEGLIERQIDQKDRRRFNIMLTDNGRLRVRSHISQHMHMIATSFNVLTTDEQTTLGHLLTKLSEDLSHDR